MTNPGSSPQVIRIAKVTIDPASVGAAVSLDVTATVNGLRVGAPVLLWAPSLEANVAICNAHCSAANTLKFRLVNPTAGAIDPASQSFFCVQL